MRIFLIVFLIVISGLTLFGILLRYSSHPPEGQVQYHPPPRVIVPNLPVEQSQEIPEVLKKLNANNAQIKGLTCDKVEIKIWEGTFSFVLDGYMRYEKPNNFRLTVDALFGKELDLGSNDAKFWFWSRKNPEPGLFYAKHEDYHKTRLKTPFNPVWIMRSLGIDEVTTQNARVIDDPGKSIMIIRQTTNASGNPILVAVFVDRNTEKISSILTTDITGKALVSAEIKEYENVLPKWIVYTWFEEKKIMELHLVNPRIGGVSNPKLWEIPDIQPQTDMGVD